MEVETPVVVEPVVAPPVTDEGSLADHEAQFGANGTGPAEAVTEPAATDTPAAEVADPGERDAAGRFKHRAKKDYASPGDVPRIAELTKRLRDAERRAEDAERRFSERVPDTDRRAAPQEPAARRTEPQTAPASASTTFPDKEPTLADFENDADPYAAYLRSLARYDRKKEQWESTQAAEVTARETAGRAIVDGYAAKKAEFAKTHPDFETVIAASAVTGMTPVLEQALLRHDKSPELVYYLAQHPDFYDEMLLLTADKPADEHFVALAQRRLSSRLQAAPTGSAVTPRPPSPAPRPPNPVRTGPMNTGDDLPGDESSLAEHERAFGPRRSRR